MRPSPAVRVLALTKYGPRAASTRQRFLQYRPLLEAAGIQLQISPLLGDEHIARLEQGRRSSWSYIGKSYLRRARALLAARKFDLAWIHCELFPYLPGWVEALGASMTPRTTIFDYDDAIFHMYDDNASRAVNLLLAGKLEPLLRRVAATTCGNAYLRDYAARFCELSLIFPTVVDTEVYRPVHRDSSERLTIGWIGSPSTWANVRPLLPVLKGICERSGARLRVIGAGREAAGDMFDRMELVPWSEEHEVAEVQGFDVGIMPLIDAPFQRGKSGYKLVQYMACGVPAVASPIGVNSDILKGGTGGILARSPDEWQQALTALLSDADLRRRMGAVGRAKAVAEYSLAVLAPRLIELFYQVANPQSGSTGALS